MKVIDFAELLGGRAGGEDEQTPPDILPEAAVERLREAMPRYVGKCPFKPGDLVTPRAGVGIKSDRVGKPYLVIDTAPTSYTPIDGHCVGTPSAG